MSPEQKNIDYRNREIAKMLGWWENEDIKGSWYTKDDLAVYVVYSLHSTENYNKFGLPFNRDWNYLMETAVNFIEKQTNGCFGGNGTSPIRFHLSKTEENKYICCFNFNQAPKFINYSLNKKECVFLSVSDFAIEWNLYLEKR